MRCLSFLRVSIGCLLVAGWAAFASAAVRLPAVIGDNMVLQRGQTVPIWGWADAGETVTVSMLGQTKSAQPNADGKWLVRLDALTAGGPHTMTVKGHNTLTLKNILVGEVWLCSGQSNMQMNVASSNNAKEEIAAAEYPQIRLVSVPCKGTQEAQQDFKGQWAECSPKTVGPFSAAAYFFGRKLYKELNVPIGLIHCSWGGSSCETWVKRCVLEADPQYKPLLESWDERVRTYDPEKAKAAWQKQMEGWKKLVAVAKAAGKEPPKAPRSPTDPRVGQHRPANCYNGMLLPLIPYAIRGAIWYQGETNAGRAYQYRELFPLMIRQWRQDWGQGDFPFYFVQLANFMAVKEQPADSAWAELREAQTMTLRTPNTGMAVIIDIGEANDIHPKNKQDVGQRLALWALAKDYGKKNLIYSGPMYRSMETKGNQIVLSFDHVGSGLLAKDGGTLRGFAIAAADKKFVWADARIVGNTVVVSSPAVPDPVAVRYAWAENPVCNLYNREGLPANPFRTDDWLGCTAKNVK
jgi:sialate O-acetylesterase